MHETFSVFHMRSAEQGAGGITNTDIYMKSEQLLGVHLSVYTEKNKHG